MKNYIKMISVLSLFVALGSCKTSAADASPKSDMVRNVEELQKREQAEKDKTDITSVKNNYGRPASK
ncbi:hypothetical protein [uncultured Chryseobacterium sp.]|uniref:hypothetical protein n=1 Tax=uncultured Chryseobacterium sp. TaxID=259322 RepID=UPI002588C114|nr:hypothetical protein [uncultured Chryseobacterium sp.]